MTRTDINVAIVICLLLAIGTSMGIIIEHKRNDLVNKNQLELIQAQKAIIEKQDRIIYKLIDGEEVRR